MAGLKHRAQSRITVGQLRQNPTAMIRDVKSGADYVLTDHGVPVAKISRYTGPTWVTPDAAAAVLARTVDPAWVRELAADRAESEMRDPFTR